MRDLKPFLVQRLAACLVVCSVLGPVAQAASTAPPPLEASSGPAYMVDAKMSPSGRWVVSLVGGGGMRDRLVLTDLEGQEPTKIITVLKTADVSSFRWVNDDWLTYSVTSAEDLSNVTRINGLLAVNRKGDRTRVLIKRSYEANLLDRVSARVLTPDHYYLAPGAPGTNEIIVGHANFDSKRWSEVNHVTPLALDIENGSTRKLVDTDIPNVHRWLFDHQGRARLADSRQDPEFSTIYWSPGDGKTWTRIAKFPILKADWEPAYVNNDALFVYRATGPNGENQLYRFNFETGKAESPARIAASGVDGEATLRVMQDVQKKIDAALPGRVNTLSCGACATPGNVLVHSYSDKDPGEYLVYQVAVNQLQRLGVQRPQSQSQQSLGGQPQKAPAGSVFVMPVWANGVPDPSKSTRRQ
jgi:hypothetical protein